MSRGDLETMEPAEPEVTNNGAQPQGTAAADAAAADAAAARADTRHHGVAPQQPTAPTATASNATLQPKLVARSAPIATSTNPSATDAAATDAAATTPAASAAAKVVPSKAVPTKAAPSKAARPTVTPSKAGPSKAAAEDLGEQHRIEKAGTLVMSARLALRRERKQEARQLLQQAFMLHATDCGALELLGDIYMEEGEQEKAIQVYERAKALHPHHAIFEEKLAVAHLDLEEMKRDRLAKELLLEQGDRDKLLDRKPHLALSLSLLLPGAGHVYNEEIERAVAFATASVVSFCGWFFPLMSGVRKQLGTQFSDQSHVSLFDAIGPAVQTMQGIGKFCFWFMLSAWIAVYAVAMLDAWAGAERANAARRGNLGL